MRLMYTASQIQEIVKTNGLVCAPFYQAMDTALAIAFLVHGRKLDAKNLVANASHCNPVDDHVSKTLIIPFGTPKNIFSYKN